MCPELFSTEEPEKSSSFGSCTSAARLSPSHSLRICPCESWFADPLFTVNNSQEIASDVGGIPWGGVTFWCLPYFPSILSFCFPSLRGIFGSCSLGRVLHQQNGSGRWQWFVLCCARESLTFSAQGQDNSQAPWLTLTQRTCWEAIEYIMSA